MAAAVIQKPIVGYSRMFACSLSSMSHSAIRRYSRMFVKFMDDLPPLRRDRPQAFRPRPRLVELAGSLTRQRVGERLSVTDLISRAGSYRDSSF